MENTTDLASALEAIAEQATSTSILEKASAHFRLLKAGEIAQHGTATLKAVGYHKCDATLLPPEFGVKAFLKGGENKVEKDERPYLTVFDIKLAQYRTVSLDTVSEIRAQGKIWQIID